MTTRSQHIGWIRQHLVSHGVAEDQSQEEAEKALAAFLKGEGVEFEDPGYHWGKEAAGITAGEYLRSTEEEKASMDAVDYTPRPRDQSREEDVEVTRDRHVTWIAQHLIAAGVGEAQAQREAEEALNAFLKDEEVVFNDPAYDWGKEAAGITAEEYLWTLGGKPT